MERANGGCGARICLLVAAHVFGGIVILLLAIWRLRIRFSRGAPPLPEKEHPLLKAAAHITHGSLLRLDDTHAVVGYGYLVW